VVTADRFGDSARLTTPIILETAVGTVMLAIDQRVHEFFIQSLQLDAFTMKLENE
jgi:hypothetical protein